MLMRLIGWGPPGGWGYFCSPGFSLVAAATAAAAFFAAAPFVRLRVGPSSILPKAAAVLQRSGGGRELCSPHAGPQITMGGLLGYVPLL